MMTLNNIINKLIEMIEEYFFYINDIIKPLCTRFVQEFNLDIPIPIFKLIIIAIDSIIMIFLPYLALFIIGYIIDRIRNYNEKKLASKLTGADNLKGSYRIGINYFIWQRKKLKLIEKIVRPKTQNSLGSSKFLVPLLYCRFSGKPKN
ncbi:hypothetical protein K4R20_03680 [Staphylococcus epidermidis]|nr:hypothetical protein [Staphylococcus epidermidis]MCG2212849.1 hypothetical protein [Staphylococcus epidermidis]MCG2389550.1 hypothetical protein [Staphylococcus epidermidis]